MTYSFSAIRFSIILFGLTLVAAVVSAGVHRLTGLQIGSGALAMVPFLIVIVLESRRFGRSLTAPPEPTECRMLALFMALSGTATYVILLLVGIVLRAGVEALASPDLYLVQVGLLLLMGALAFGAGMLVTRSVATAAFKDRT